MGGKRVIFWETVRKDGRLKITCQAYAHTCGTHLRRHTRSYIGRFSPAGNMHEASPTYTHLGTQTSSLWTNMLRE